LPDELPDCDVALVAGDVDDAPILSMKRLMDQPSLDGRYIFFVPGNHEFYDRFIEDFETADPEADRLTQVTNLHMKVDVAEGVRFVGATLWTDYALYGTVMESMARCRHDINDHAHIRTGEGVDVVEDEGGYVHPALRRPWRFFTPEDALRRHREQVAFLDAALSVPFDGPTVVMTHHAPHRSSISLKWIRNKSNPGYASDLTWLIERHEPALWVHGHIHSSSDYRLGKTRILCNPLGLRRDGMPENMRFDPWLVVEV
jgi:hypothetical protein